jgi:hypothetical protein
MLRQRLPEGEYRLHGEQAQKMPACDHANRAMPAKAQCYNGRAKIDPAMMPQ